jgi:hypothetical protein
MLGSLAKETKQVRNDQMSGQLAQAKAWEAAD